MSNFVTKYAASSQEFEQGFFQLAYDKLQSKLFNLLPFMVGFELVKRSPDDTRAIGVFGFKSGNGQILYVPAFFINGKVKDMEIMYSKNNNQFYPLNEDFAALFLKDDVTGIGAPSRESKEEIQRSSRQSNLTDIIRPPRTGKMSYAEAKDDVEFNAEMHKTATTNWLEFKETKAAATSLTEFLTEAPTHVKTAFISLLEKDAEYASAVRGFYTDDELVAALTVKQAALVPEAEPELRLVRFDEDSALNKEAAATKTKLLDKGFCLVDKRPDTKKSVVGLFTYTEKFGNPVNPGCYQYVTQLGDLCKGLVLTKPRSLMTGFSLDKTIVVNLETEKLGQAYIVKNKEVFVKDSIVVKDFSELLNGLPEPAEATPGFDDCVLINERLVVSQPFRIVENFKDVNGIRKLKVRCTYGWNDPACCNSESVSERETFLVLTKQNNDKLEHRNGIVYVPRGFKLLQLKTGVYCYPKYDVNESEASRDKKRKAADAEENRLKASRPGGLHCLELLLATKNVFPLTLQSNGSEYFLNIQGAKAKYASAEETLISLVAEAGLAETDAQMLLDSVKLKHKSAGTIKLAYLGDQYLNMQEEQPSMDEFGTPTYHGVPYTETASTEDGYQGDPTQMGLGVKPDQDTVNQNVNSATSLAQGGQKEIFDTQSIATLSRYTDPSSKILSYVPDFITSLDKLGRMLFMSYWQTEEFEEMYGKDELPELVELVKNVFNNLGDLIIFLKRKVPDLSINTNEQAADQI